MDSKDPQTDPAPWYASLPVTSTHVRALVWGISLFCSIVVTALQVYPALMGRVILGLIGFGFLLFLLARMSLDPQERASMATHDLSRPARVLYWTGYALMFSGVGLSVLIFLV